MGWGRYIRRLYVPVGLLWILVPGSSAAETETSVAQQLRIPIRHLISGAALKFHEPMELTSTTRITVTRLEYLLTDVKLLGSNGIWLNFPDRYFHLNPLEKQSELVLDNVTSSSWKALALNVGVPPELNHADPARWAAGHPLNVLECNLHWSWNAGYVFLALEGSAQQEKTPRKTFLYHLGNDPLLMRVELPLDGNVSLDDSELVFHVDRVWNGSERIAPGDGGGMSHSSANDTLAPRLAGNIKMAFEVRPRGL